jgi:peroxiredoxin
MPRETPLLFAFALVLAALGAAALAAATAPVPGPERAAAPRPSVEARVPGPAPGPRGEDAAVDAALKRLDLIKPTRTRYAEDFSLPRPEGSRFTLSEQRGKIVLVNFWATWCPPCLEELPAMERLWRRHKDEGFVLVAISLDADPAKVPPYVAAHRFTFPIAVDPKMAVAEKYGVRALPSSFVIDRDGTMAGVALGPRAWDDRAAHALVQAMLR